MGYWAKLASRAAFRKGRAQYCGYTNDVVPGMWSGGMVGLKSILGVKSRSRAIDILNTLQQYGYVYYTLNEKTKKLEYTISDWVIKCAGAECMNGAVYAADGYGFLCLPRSITQRLAEQHYTFGESDAWLDFWCHTVWQETVNAFSYLAPAVQLGRLGAALTLEALGQLWGWEKTKVWRFFQKHGDVFALYRLPGAYGCLIFNKLYPLDTEASLPTHTEIERIIGEMRIWADNTHMVHVSLTAEEVIAQLCRLMHAEDLHEKDDCVYRGESFLSNGTEDAEAVRAIETVEVWLRKQYPQPR